MNTVLRKAIPNEIFDYQQAMSALSIYRSPRAHLTQLMRKKHIIRIRKGLYVFGDDLRRRAVVPELLANLIYGPSYISLEYALSYHGMIPEQVSVLTSVTTGRSRSFDTPLGRFSYRQISASAFCTGFTRIELDGISFLIALPEKALADKLAADRQGDLRSRRAMLSYLLDNQRIEKDTLLQLSSEMLHDIALRYKSRKLGILTQTILHLKG